MESKENENRETLHDLLHCMICLEPYKDPRILRCGHTFCEPCLAKCFGVYQKHGNTKAGKLPCPLCRRHTRLPSGGTTGLPHDFKVKKLKDVLAHMGVPQSKLKDNEGRCCDLCKSLGKCGISEFYCTDCLKHLCGLCIKKHHENLVFCNHNVVDLSSENASTITFCTSHPSEPIKYLCRSCNRMECGMGVMIEHNGHDVIELTIALSQQHDKLKDLLIAVNTVNTGFKQQKSRLENLQQSRVTSYQNAQKSIQSRAAKMIAQIKIEESELLTKLSNLHAAKIKQTQDDVDNLNFQLANIETLSDFARTRLRMKSNLSLQLFEFSDELIARMSTLTELQGQKKESKLESDLNIVFVPGGENEGRVGRLEDCNSFTQAWMAPGSTSPRRPSTPRPSTPRPQCKQALQDPNTLFMRRGSFRSK